MICGAETIPSNGWREAWFWISRGWLSWAGGNVTSSSAEWKKKTARRRVPIQSSEWLDDCPQFLSRVDFHVPRQIFDRLSCFLRRHYATNYLLLFRLPYTTPDVDWKLCMCGCRIPVWSIQGSFQEECFGCRFTCYKSNRLHLLLLLLFIILLYFYEI